MSVTTGLRNNKKALLHSEKYRKLSLKPQRGGGAICFLVHLQKYLCHSVSIIKQSSISLTFCKKAH